MPSRSSLSLRRWAPLPAYRRHRALLVGVVLILNISCFGRSAEPPTGEPELVSLIRLIGSPDDFHGERVTTAGFLSLAFEGTALYVHEADFRQAIPMNAVWLTLDPGSVSPELNESYVIVEGRFDATNNGHFGIFSGRLDEISRVETHPSRLDFAPTSTTEQQRQGDLPADPRVDEAD